MRGNTALPQQCKKQLLDSWQSEAAGSDPGTWRTHIEGEAAHVRHDREGGQDTNDLCL